MSAISIKQLLEAGVHFGHQTHRWNPKMKDYIFGERNGIYIIDLQKTLKAFQEAVNFVAEMASRGKTLLFVGTKPQAQESVQEEALRCGMFYVNHRWLGGMLTNFQTIQISIKRYKELEDQKESGFWEKLSKKEVAQLERERKKLESNLKGIRDMNRLPDAIFVVDSNKEAIAVKEANKLGIPVIAIVDTNCDPDVVDYVIPGNDDALRSIRLFASTLADAALAGNQVYEAHLEAKRKEAEKKAAEEKARRKAAAEAKEAARKAREEAKRKKEEEEAAKKAAKKATEKEAKEKAEASSPDESEAEVEAAEKAAKSAESGEKAAEKAEKAAAKKAGGAEKKKAGKKPVKLKDAAKSGKTAEKEEAASKEEAEAKKEKAEAAESKEKKAEKPKKAAKSKKAEKPKKAAKSKKADKAEDKKADKPAKASKKSEEPEKAKKSAKDEEAEEEDAGKKNEKAASEESKEPSKKDE